MQRARPSTVSVAFFAVFWIAYGVAALRIALRARLETAAVRVLALALFVAERNFIAGGGRAPCALRKPDARRAHRSAAGSRMAGQLVARRLAQSG
jgi:hypothetical protein